MKRFFMNACPAVCFFLSVSVLGLHAEPLALSDSELSNVTGQSGMDVSGISIGGFSLNLGTDGETSDECTDQDALCEEKEKNDALMLSITDMLPSSGWNAGHMLMADPAFINPVAVPISVTKPLEIIQPITSVVSMLPVQPVNIMGSLPGFSF